MKMNLFKLALSMILGLFTCYIVEPSPGTGFLIGLASCFFVQIIFTLLGLND